VRVRGERVPEEHDDVHAPLDDPGTDLHIAALRAAAHALDGEVELLRELGSRPVER